MGEIRKTFRGVEFKFGLTATAPALVSEIFGDNYEVLSKGIVFGDGDVVVDLGANEGVFSVFVAKLFPGIKVYAFEPVGRTYETLVRNIKLNDCTNVTAFNYGVGKPGVLKGVMNVDKVCSGGSSLKDTFNPASAERVEVELMSLDTIFQQRGIDRCRLLKVDIEGSEYDVLYGCTVLSRVDYVVAEIHMNNRLDFESRRPDGLATWIGNQTALLHVDYCRMSE